MPRKGRIRLVPNLDHVSVEIYLTISMVSFRIEAKWKAQSESEGHVCYVAASISCPTRCSRIITYSQNPRSADSPSGSYHLAQPLFTPTNRW